jgi:hypothetical protein
MHKPLGIFAFTNLAREESEWQSVSESPSTGAYVGFLFACYSTPYVIHAASVAVSREHRRAKTDRLDTELLKRASLGWLRGERDPCKMVAIPTLSEEKFSFPELF